MEKIASFTVNHLDLLPGVYVAEKIMWARECFTTFDLRMCAPNREPVMDAAEYIPSNIWPPLFCETMHSGKTG